MRIVPWETVSDAVRNLFMQANYEIGNDVQHCVEAALKTEESEYGQAVLGQLLENYAIAKKERVAICQDTGMAVLFVRMGQDVHVTGAGMTFAINDGVRRAYKDGFLRASVVRDPLYDRANTCDNTPAVIHYDMVSGDKIELTAAPKGFGSENMSRIGMLAPSAGEQGVIDFVTETVRLAGPNPCPPVVVGVGIGGTMEQAALIAKHALTRPLDESNPDGRYALLENVLLEKINRLGIGPAGLGGRTTALKVQIEVRPTHIAGMPVAVNMCCHAARHASCVI